MSLETMLAERNEAVATERRTSAWARYRSLVRIDPATMTVEELDSLRETMPIIGKTPSDFDRDRRAVLKAERLDEQVRKLEPVVAEANRRIASRQAETKRLQAELSRLQAMDAEDAKPAHELEKARQSLRETTLTNAMLFS